jgi:hypothetical protein
MLHGQLFNGAGLHLPTATGGPIWLCINSYYIVPTIQQRLQ